MAASCSSDECVNTVEDVEIFAPVTVRVSDFLISQEAGSGVRTRKTVGEYNYLKALTLAFYKSDGTEVYKVTQFRGNASTYTTFGEFSCSLGVGNYTMVVLGYGQGNVAQEITLTSPTSATYGEGRVRETFTATKTVSITNTSAVNLTATLRRVVSRLDLLSTDTKPADVTHIRVTCSGGSKQFNPTSGLTESSGTFVNMLNLSNAVGTVCQYSTFLFLASNEQKVDVTIETLDGEDGNVIYRKTIPDVPLMRNRATSLTGRIFSADASAGSFSVESEWLDEHPMTF